jgi:hypothetical protein
MFQRFRIMNEDYIPFTTLFKKEKRQIVKKKKKVLKHPHLHYPCFTVVLYKPLVEQVHGNERVT